MAFRRLAKLVAVMSEFVDFGEQTFNQALFDIFK